jgi:hypothetical protein
MATTDYKPYDQGEIESIRLMLEAEAKEGTPLCFDVKVNGNTRIHKTNKVERFNELYNFINDTTKELVINVYPDPNNNNRKEWYKYTFGKIEEPMGGVGDMEQKLNERMKVFEEKQAAKRVEEKLKETEEKLSQAEDYIQILEDKLEAAKVKPNHIGQIDLAKLGAGILEGVATQYPKVLEKVPVLNGIAKVIHDENKSKPQQLNGSFEGDVSFKAKSKTTDLSPEAIEHEETVRRLVDFIGEKFDERQRSILGMVIVELGENTSQLETVAELLNIDLNAENENDEE